MNKSLKPQPIEYQRIDMEALHSSILDAGGYDDKPLIFFGNEKYTKRVVGNHKETLNIIKSFNNFRDIIETMTQEHEHDLDTFGGGGMSTKQHCEPEVAVDPLESIEPYVLPDVIYEPSLLATTKQRTTALNTAAEATSKKSR